MWLILKTTGYRSLDARHAQMNAHQARQDAAETQNKHVETTILTVAQNGAATHNVNMAALMVYALHAQKILTAEQMDSSEAQHAQTIMYTRTIRHMHALILAHHQHHALHQ